MSTQREVTAAAFLAFADIIEQSLNGTDEIKKGVVKSSSNLWKVIGVTFAASYFKHGVLRFGGLDYTMEADAISLLRAVSKELSTSNTPLHAALISQQAALLPNLSMGSKLAIGLEDNETEYSGDLLIIDLHDLDTVQVQPNGGVSVKIDGSIETLSFNFQNKTLGDWINQHLPIQPPVAAPSGP